MKGWSDNSKAFECTAHIWAQADDVIRAKLIHVIQMFNKVGQVLCYCKNSILDTSRVEIFTDEHKQIFKALVTLIYNVQYTKVNSVKKRSATVYQGLQFVFTSPTVQPEFLLIEGKINFKESTHLCVEGDVGEGA